MSEVIITLASDTDLAYALRTDPSTWFPSGGSAVASGDLWAKASFEGGTDYVNAVGLLRFLTALSSNSFISAAYLLITLTAKSNADTLVVKFDHYLFGGNVTNADYTESVVGNAASVAISAFTVGVEKVIEITNASAYIPPVGACGFRIGIPSESPPTGENKIIAVRADIKLKLVYSSVQKATLLTPNSGSYDRTQTIRAAWQHNDADGHAQTGFDWRYSTDGGATWSSPVNQTTANQYYDIPGGTLAAGPIKHQVRTYVGTDVGDWSDAAMFTAGAAVAVPTVTAPSGTITTAYPTVTWTSGETGRVAFYVLITNSAGTVIYYSSGRVAGSGLSHAIPTPLPDVTSMKAKVAVESAAGVVGAYGESSFTTALLPVAAATLTVLPVEGAFGEQDRLRITADNPAVAGGFATPSYNILRRSFDGGATWVIVNSALAVDGIHDDYDVPQGRTAHYSVITVATNGAQTTSGSANSQLSFRGLLIHNTADAANSIQHHHLFMPASFGSRNTPDTVFRRRHGRDEEVAVSGGHRSKVIPFAFIVIVRNGQVAFERDIEALEALLESKARLCVRTPEIPKGRVYKGTVDGEVSITPNSEMLLRAYNVSFNIRLTGEQVQ